MKVDRETCAEAIDACACFAFARASRSVTQHYNSFFRQGGLRSTQFSLLAHVLVHEPATMGLLADEMVLDRSTLTRNLRPLTDAGYLKVTRPKGERAKVVRITAKGRRKLEATAGLWRTAHELFLKAFGEARWSTTSKSVKLASDTARAI